MNKESLEHLSSLMDGEISRETGLFLTRRLCSDEELKSAWTRFHLIRDCIQRPGSAMADNRLGRELWQRLEEEHTSESAKRGMPGWLKPAGGLAIAASVALMAVFTFGPMQQQAGTSDVAGSETPPPFSSPNILPAAAASQAVSFSPSGQDRTRRLNSYLMRHNQLAGSAGRQGFVSFVPIVSGANADDSETLPEETEKPTTQEIQATGTP